MKSFIERDAGRTEVGIKQWGESESGPSRRGWQRRERKLAHSLAE